MKILFDVGHPSFVHLFHKVANQLINEGHKVMFSARNKDITVSLLVEYKLPYIVTGHHAKNAFHKIIRFISGTFGLIKLIRRFKPDVVLSGASPYASIASIICGKKHFLFDDTENKEQSLLYRIGASLIFTPDVFESDLGSKHIKYPGFHELAYLPDNLEFSNKRNLILVRFVEWSATHDIFRKGLSNQQKTSIVNWAKSIGKVIVSSELELPDQLKPYAYDGKPGEYHKLYKQAKLLIGESATMATEAACSGVPAIYIDEAGRSYTKYIEKRYGLIKSYFPENFTIESVMEWFNSNEKQQLVETGFERLLQDHIDVSKFIGWLIQYHQNEYLSDFIRKENFFNQFKLL